MMISNIGKSDDDDDGQNNDENDGENDKFVSLGGHPNKRMRV